MHPYVPRVTPNYLLTLLSIYALINIFSFFLSFLLSFFLSSFPMTFFISTFLIILFSLFSYTSFFSDVFFFLLILQLSFLLYFYLAFYLTFLSFTLLLSFLLFLYWLVDWSLQHSNTSRGILCMKVRESRSMFIFISFVQVLESFFSPPLEKYSKKNARNLYKHSYLILIIIRCQGAFEIWKRNHSTGGQEWRKIYSPQNYFTRPAPFSVNNSQWFNKSRHSKR